ncbi:MAG: TonB-dependent receptor plug domain-containing protein [Burkholderiaceae bacterium]|nr:TonB-dependent receptor plug domain-containing protein [Burkholderiaceae bacterium]
MNYRLPLLIVALSTLAAPAVAQQDGTLPEVKVTADRYVPMPQPAGAVTRSSLFSTRAATSDTASLLRDVPGVSLGAAGGVSSLPSVRGLGDDRLRIKVDGMDLLASCPNHMNPALSYLDPSQVGTLYVYAGVTPVSVGGDSIGGTIIAESTPPAFAPAGQGPIVSGEIGGFYRSNNHARGLNLGTGYATQTFAATYRGAIARAGNYTAGGNFKTFTATGRPGQTLPLDEVGSSAYDTRNHALDFAWRDATQLLELGLGHQDMPFQLYPNQRMDLLKNRQNRVNVHYLSQKDWGLLDARFYHEAVEHFMDFGRDKQLVYGKAPYVVAVGMPMWTKGKTTGAVVKADIDLSKRDLLRIGAELQRYRLDDWWPPSPADLAGMLFSATNPVPATFAGMAPDTFWNINNGKRDRTGAFVEWEGRWTSHWMTLLGARIERVTTDTGPVQGYNSVANNMMYSQGYLISAAQFNALDRKRSDTNIDLTALARHTPDDNHTYELGFARKTRTPNLYERYSWSRNAMAAIMNNFVGDGNGYIGNVDLKPEVAYTIGASASWHSADRSTELKLAPFYTHVTDYVDAVNWNRQTNVAATPVPGQFGLLKYMNQDARLYGMDVSGRMPLGTNRLGAWSARAVVNYTHGRNHETGSGLYNVMPLNARLSLHQATSGWENALELVAVRAKTNVSAPRQELQTSGYALVNWRGSYTWRSLRVDFGIENLFDRLYALPLGGVYLGQGMTMSIAGVPFGIAVPGMGRSFHLGATYRF